MGSGGGNDTSTSTKKKKKRSNSFPGRDLENSGKSDISGLASEKEIFKFSGNGARSRRDIMRKILGLLKPSNNSSKRLKRETLENCPLRTRLPAGPVMVAEEVKFRPGMDLAGVETMSTLLLLVLQIEISVIPVVDPINCQNVLILRR